MLKTSQTKCVEQFLADILLIFLSLKVAEY